MEPSADLLWLMHTTDAACIRGLEDALLGRAARRHVPQLQLHLLRQPAGQAVAIGARA